MQTILAIDDEESVRQSYRVILDPDYEVLLADGGEAGLKLIEEKHVDLVLLDLTMPVMSGEEVLKRLQDQGETTPVVVVTASSASGSLSCGSDWVSGRRLVGIACATRAVGRASPVPARRSSGRAIFFIVIVRPCYRPCRPNWRLV